MTESYSPSRRCRSVRAETLGIGTAESVAVPRLVVAPRTDLSRVAGIGLLQLALAFEVPRVTSRLVLAAGLPALGRAPVKAGAIRRRLLATRRGSPIRKLGSRDHAIAVAVAIGEAALGPLPLVARQSAIAVDVQSRERIGRLR